MGYVILYFAPFSTKAACTRLYPDQPVTNTISSKLTETAPLPIPFLYHSMSTSPTPATPPTHNSPSNAPGDPTTALTTLMHQTLQQNAMTMTQLQTRPSTPLVKPTPITPKYKPCRPPFPKCYGLSPTTPLLLA